MKRLPSLSRGQTVTEYMLVVAVIAIASMAAVAIIYDPNQPVQKAAAQMSQNYCDGLTNDGCGNKTMDAHQ